MRKLQRKVLKSWDKAAAVSRATLEQKLSKILGESREIRAPAWTE
jgi:hypothetical protein